MSKIGVFGGTFNPPHNGHLLLAKKALEIFSLDKVIWMPTGNSYMKTGVTDKQTRLSMTRLLVNNQENMEVSSLEVEREGASYTFETLSILKQQNPEAELFLILGGDSLQKIRYWRNPEIIFSKAAVICAYRAEDSQKENYLHSLKCIAGELSAQYNATIHLMDFDVNISSTKIREAIHGSEDATQYLPDILIDYIKTNHLYMPQ